MTEQDQVPRRARGERPYFFDDPAIDQLYAMFLAMSAEMSVAWDRVDALERLLADKGLLEPGEVSAYRPDEAAERARAEHRRHMIERVFRVLSAPGESAAAASDMPETRSRLEELKRV